MLFYDIFFAMFENKFHNCMNKHNQLRVPDTFCFDLNELQYFYSSCEDP